MKLEKKKKSKIIIFPKSKIKNLKKTALGMSAKRVFSERTLVTGSLASVFLMLFALNVLIFSDKSLLRSERNLASSKDKDQKWDKELLRKLASERYNETEDILGQAASLKEHLNFAYLKGDYDLLYEKNYLSEIKAKSFKKHPVSPEVLVFKYRNLFPDFTSHKIKVFQKNNSEHHLYQLKGEDKDYFIHIRLDLKTKNLISLKYLENL